MRHPALKPARALGIGTHAPHELRHASGAQGNPPACHSTLRNSNRTTARLEMFSRTRDACPRARGRA
eukprot:7284613-Pyramimonas_sp.AAC.1